MVDQMETKADTGREVDIFTYIKNCALDIICGTNWSEWSPCFSLQKLQWVRSSTRKPERMPNIPTLWCAYPNTPSISLGRFFFWNSNFWDPVIIDKNIVVLVLCTDTGSHIDVIYIIYLYRFPHLWLKPIWYGCGRGFEFDRLVKLTKDFTLNVRLIIVMGHLWWALDIITFNLFCSKTYEKTTQVIRERRQLMREEGRLEDVNEATVF